MSEREGPVLVTPMPYWLVGSIALVCVLLGHPEWFFVLLESPIYFINWLAS